jgi:hypothetical protein
LLRHLDSGVKEAGKSDHSDHHCCGNHADGDVSATTGQALAFDEALSCIFGWLPIIMQIPWLIPRNRKTLLTPALIFEFGPGHAHIPAGSHDLALLVFYL